MTPKGRLCRHSCKSGIFPLISFRICGYPKDQALKVAKDTIEDFLLGHDLEVALVLLDRAS